MGKKLLFVFFTLSLFFLNPVSVFGQCTASVSISSSDAGNTICAGESVTFTATPTNGGSNPLYQWRVNGVNVGTNNSVNTYSTTALQTGFVVSVVLTSDIVNCGSGNPVVSNNIATTVNPIPTAPTVGSNNPVCVGEIINLTASTITGATYLWTGPNSFTSSSQNPSIPNATAAMEGSYSVVATVAGCKSNPATTSVVVNTIPSSPIAGSNSPVCAGEIINLTASTIAGATYLWTGPNSFTSTSQNPSISNATAAMEGSYSVVANVAGCQSNPATTAVIVNTIPSSPTAGSNSPVCAGEVINLTTSAITGATYLWTGPNSFTSTLQNPSISNASATMGGTYNVTVTVAGCKSNPATTSVAINPTISPSVSITSTSTAICSSSGSPVTFTATPVNGGNSPSYQWKQNNINISGATGATYTPNSLANPSTISVVMTSNAICPSPATATSNDIVMTVYSGTPPPPVFSSSNENINVANGVCPPVSGLVYSVIPNTNATSYNWVVPSGWNIVSGNGTNAITVNATTSVNDGNNIFSATAVNACGMSLASTFNVDVNKSAGVSAGPDANICVGDTYTLSGTKSGYAQKVLWTSSPSTGTFSNSTSLTSTYSPAITSGTVTLILTTTKTKGNPSCPLVSDEMILTVNQPPAITEQPIATQTLCSGSPANFSVTATGTGLSYQWKKGGTNITGATSSTYSISNVNNSDAGTYTVDVSGVSPCTPVTSQNAVLYVNQAIAITTQPTTTQTLCSGSSANFSISATGTGLSYQWKKGGVNIPNATSSTYSISSVGASDNGNYTVEVFGTSPCASVTSSIAALTVNQPVIITAQPTATQTLCSGSPLNLSVTATGTGLSYQWKKGGTNILGATSNSYSISSVNISDNGNYTVEVFGTSPCASTTSSTATLTVNQPVVITTQPDTSQTVCTGFPVSFSVTATGTGLSYQWKKGGTDITGATSSTYSISNVSTADAASYTVAVSGASPCTPVTSGNAVLNVNQDIAISSQPVAAVVCEGNNTSFSVAATGTGLSYQWRKGGIPISDGGNISGTTMNTLILTGALINNSGSYDVVISSPGGTCPQTISNPATLTVNKKSADPTSATASVSTFCNGGSSILNLVGGGGGGTGEVINWYTDSCGGTLIGTGNDLLVSPTITTTYYGRYENPAPCSYNSICASVTVTVNYTSTMSLSSAASSTSQTLCINNAISPITYTIGGGGTDATITAGALPTGVTGAYSNGIFTISGTPSVAGTFNYTVSTSGPCDNVELSGTINIDNNSIMSLSSAASSTSQTLCINNAISPITYTIGGGGTDATITAGALPTGVTGAYSNGIFTISGTPSVAGTFNYTVSTSGPCANVSLTGSITIDPIPIGGKLTFSGTTLNSYLICYSATGSISKSIELTEYTGTVVRWERSNDAGISWSDVGHPGETTFNDFSGISSTTLFRAILSSGVCGNTTSKIAIVNVIPDNIKPSPVEADKSIVCLGESVNLTSETGYASGSYITSGYFNNANPKGWIVDGDPGNNFPANGNNTKPNRWSETNDHPFDTRDGSKVFDSKDKKFAIVSGQNLSTLETPVFNTFGLSTASLKFDEAFIMGPNTSMKIELSVDGGNSYTVILRDQAYGLSPDGVYRTNNYADFSGSNQSIDLSNYVGQANLKVRFTFDGRNDPERSIWAIDGVTLPDTPLNIDIIWTDENGGTIGNTEDITVVPDKPGVNIYNVTAYIILDDSGEPCYSSGGNTSSVSVYAYDNYSTIATLVPDQNIVCGSNSVLLQGKIISAYENAEVTAFAEGDNSTVKWTVDGLSQAQSDSYFSDPTDPNAVFTAPFSPTPYVLNWTITVDPKSTCPAPSTPIQIVFKECTTLDFDGIDDYVDIGTTFTGNYSIEAWVRPESSEGTIISGPNFEISLVGGNLKYNSKTFTAALTPNSRWYHVAATSNGELYVDGILIDSGAGTVNGSSKSLIGAKWNDTNNKAENYFSGWIEEVRIWNKQLTLEQIQFMMNQHLQNTANMGKEIPIPVPGTLIYNDLEGYYPLISKTPDPNNLETFDVGLMPINGFTPDISLSNIASGRLYNMTTDQENTAPLPYISASDGLWSNINTWLRPDVWNAPNSVGIKASERINWNIVRTNHNIQSGDRDITVLGLKSETLDKRLEISGPGAKDEFNAGQMIRITHYLLLDGNMDLVGESQLLQDQGSILEETSKGWLKRDQQGKKMSFNYNYWSSPVSAQGAANNAPYLIKDIMNYGWLNAATGTINPLVFTADSNPYGADNLTMNTCPYWLWRFHGLADDYDSWIFIGTTGSLKTGEGHTMKGTTYDGTADYSHSQNYGYKGKPHNGDITLGIAPNENYLVGNPYPSALNANEFILDNLNSSTVNGATNNKNLFNGVIYFWDHFSGATHILREYIGGYATLNLIGGAPAISTDERINANDAIGGKEPKQFIPVGQGFFVNSGTDEQFSGGVPFTMSAGDLVFKNSQRVFARESSGSSIFLKPEIVVETGKKEAKSTISKIRISFRSPKGYNRQLLVGAHPNTTNGFDIGYDAPMIEYNNEDMYWVQGGNFLVIQGVPDFGKDQVLPLGIRIDKAGDFTIKIDTLENINADHTIYLKDIALDTIHDLRSGVYTSFSEPGEITDRFQLIFYKEQSTPDPDPIVVDEPIIDDLTEISLLHSYTENEMMVLNPKELQISAIYLFDLNGKLLEVFDEVPSEKEIRLKVTNFSEGIYILKMHTDNEIVTRKIIIKK